MKKLFLSMAAAAMAFAANATLYIVGDDQGWNISNPTKVELNSEGNYQFTVQKSFKMSTTNPNNDWNTFNGGAKVPSSPLQKVQRQTVSLTSSQDNVNLPYGDGSVKFTVTVNSSFTQATFVGASAPTGGYDNVYLRGNGNWDSCTSANQFTTTDGVHYKMTGVTLSSAFKIADSSWGSINYGYNGTFPLNTETTLTYNANDITVAGMPISNATLEFNLTSHTLKVTGEAGGEYNPDAPDFSAWWVNIGGSFNDNDYYNNGVQPVNGIVTFSNLGIGTGNFKVKTWDGSTDRYYISDGSAIPTDQWVQLYEDNSDGAPITIQGATASSVYTVKFDCSNNQIYVETTGGGGGNDDGYPQHVYVIGDIVGNVWNTTASNEMTNEGDGLYTIEGLKIQNGNAATMGYFALTTVQSSDWNVVNSNRFGPAVQDTEAVEGENPVDGTGDLAWSIAPGTYDMEFNYNDKTLSITKVSGDVPVDPDPDPEPGEFPETLYLIGNVNGYNWSTSQGVAATNEDGVYTYIGVTVNNSGSGSGYFSFATVLGEDWDGEGNVNSGDRYGATNKDEAIEAGEESMVMRFAANVSASGCNSWMLAPGNYDMVVNLNEMTLLVTVGEGGDIPVDPTPGELPEKLYLIGNVNGHNWDTPITGVETMGDEGVYVWEEVAVADAGSGKGYFNIATVVGGGWDDTVNTANRYGAPANDTPLEIGQTSAVTLYAVNVNASGCQSWSVDAGTYTVIVNLNEMEITLADASTDGVESLVTEEGEAVYFNLQGQKVANPDKGIYIKVVNGKAVKVIK